MEEIWEGTKDRNLEAEIEAEAIRSAVCWLAPPGLLGLFTLSDSGPCALEWHHPQ